jgi:putative ABC transport system permease protein
MGVERFDASSRAKMSGKLRDAFPAPVMLERYRPPHAEATASCTFRRARLRFAQKAGEFGVLIAALRDLQWRRRRFMIAIVGTSVLFAMTLVLTGLSHGFAVEAEDTVDDIGVDLWMIPTGVAGPFLGASPFAAATASAAVRIDGVTAAVPLISSGTTMREDGDPRNVNVFGAPPDGPGMPAVSSGRAPVTADEIAVSSALDHRIGDEVELGASALEVVGVVNDSTALAGQPNVFLTLEGAQAAVFAGQPLVSSIGVVGDPRDVPAGFQLIDRDAAVDDLMRPLEPSYSAITFIAVLLWIVAALIVGSVIYLSALERVRDFAVFKAVGVSTRSVMGGLALQAVIVAVVGALLGAVLSLVLAPAFPMRVVVPVSAYALLPAIAILVGLAASVAGLRRAVKVDPALAFGGP